MAPSSNGVARRAEVLVIGGGIMGTSVAFHLARAGVRGVVLLEAGELASGSSGKPLGGMRAQFSDRANVELALRSLAAYRRFDTEVGADIGLRQVGYLFALREQADVDAFAASIALQNRLGVASSLIDPDEAVARCPYLSLPGLLAASWSPDDGFARPTDAVRGYAAAASALGAEIRTNAPVAGIEPLPGGAGLVTTAGGDTYRAPTVVCAAGAWSRPIGEQVGVDLPIDPVRRQIAFTPPPHPALRSCPPRVPFTIDYSTTAYFHEAEDGGLLLGWADPAEPVGYDRQVSTGWHEPLRTALRSFAPALAELPLSRGWAGFYEVTPDCNALIGETSTPGFRFLYAAGFSGHGFLQGPAVGEAIRDRYLGREPAVDVSCFDAERFARPAVRTELAII